MKIVSMVVFNTRTEKIMMRYVVGMVLKLEVKIRHFHCIIHIKAFNISEMAHYFIVFGHTRWIQFSDFLNQFATVHIFMTRQIIAMRTPPWGPRISG